MFAVSDVYSTVCMGNWGGTYTHRVITVPAGTSGYSFSPAVTHGTELACGDPVRKVGRYRYC